MVAWNGNLQVSPVSLLHTPAPLWLEEPIKDENYLSPSKECIEVQNRTNRK